MSVIFSLFLLLAGTMVYAQSNQFIQNGNVRLSTTVYGSEKEETIILLHGGPGVPDDMLEVVNRLKDNYRVITFEQRGVGLSECDGCTYEMQDYISDIDSIANHYNITEFHLFGHSWGGLYAQIYAVEKPDMLKSLFLCSPGSGTNKLWKTTEKEVMQFNKKMTSTKEWITMGWNSFLGLMGSDNAYRKLFKQVLINYHSDYGEIIIDEEILNKIHSKPINKTRKEIGKYPPLKVMVDIKFPMQITYGANDIYGESKRKLIERFPTAQVKVIDNCGHVPWKHNPGDFEAVLNAFYKKSK